MQKHQALIEEKAILKTLLEEVQSIKLQQTKTNGVLSVLVNNFTNFYTFFTPSV